MDNLRLLMEANALDFEIQVYLKQILNNFLIV